MSVCDPFPASLRGDGLFATLDRTLPGNLVERALPSGFRRSVRLSPPLE
jgi:hypothetical protein